ncbi:hypothetical protein SKAU_G00233990 [Synaphobranchus kaupii]|uniref:Uncharacterized protein n=1 Tax=Synaphobranchus kaupii TaxID=118154 RepID=A0A9Q1IRI3_SYNKA|nr:hypothetical protein SKAU_G00233990 [Synaphobranchus kaupii]
MLRPKLLKHRENTDYRQSRYEAAGEQWEQERPGKEMETDNQWSRGMSGSGSRTERSGRRESHASRTPLIYSPCQPANHLLHS